MDITKCTASNCCNVIYCKNLCSKHYQSWRKIEKPSGRVVMCAKCGTPGVAFAMSSMCKNCRKKQMLEWKNNNQERVRSLDRNAHKRRHKTLREMALLAYGGVCKCCGETHPAFLAIDHVNSDGNTHRKQLGGTGSFPLLKWLADQNYPQSGFQILCHNCNFAKSLDGCPHVSETK